MAKQAGTVEVEPKEKRETLIRAIGFDCDRIRIEQALRFYGTPRNHLFQSDLGTSRVGADGGALARTMLGLYSYGEQIA